MEILDIRLLTDFKSTFDEKSSIKLIGFDMAKACAEQVYKAAGITPKDVNVCELHDCFSANELVTYEALGFCPIGKAGESIDRGDFTYGGKIVVNPSGGLISKGHPLGATASHSAPNSAGRLEAWPTNARSRTAKSPFSTTSDSAAQL